MREDVLRAQRENNIGSAELWDDYAAHRDMTTDVISRVRQGSTDGRLVVLGAGNCNDLNLAELQNMFSEVHLVDIDETAMRAGVGRQNMASASQLEIHGAIDVTAFPEDLLSHLRGSDVVLSACLLTQLIDTAEQDGLDGRGMLAVRDAHLRLVARLAEDGGIGVIVTDVVSSETLPQLGTTPVQNLPSLLVECVNSSNFFTGTNPFAIERILKIDPQISATRVRISPPWLWRLKKRTYLVSAIAFQAKGTQAVHVERWR